MSLFRLMQLWREVGERLRDERKHGESLIDCLNRVIAEARKWREVEEVADATVLTLDDDANAVPASGLRLTKTAWEVDVDGRLIPGTVREHVAPQPAPQNQDGPALWPMIIRELGESELDRLLAADMLQRHEFGVAKYGVPLVASNGRDHLADAYQEFLDTIVYLRASIERSLNKRVDKTNTRELARLHQLYVDTLDSAKEIRELILARDGK